MIEFKFRKTKRAVTLVELVIVLALMSIVTMLVFNFYSLSQRKGKELDIRQSLQHEGNMISESMMKNIFQCKDIDGVVGVNPSIVGDNSINSIKFNLNGKWTLPLDSIIDNIVQVEYRLDKGELKFFVWQELFAGSTPREKEIQTIAEDVKEVKIVNKDILSKVSTYPLESTEIENLIKKEKGINLEVTLEKKGIKHINAFELNFRNSN